MQTGEPSLTGIKPDAVAGVVSTLTRTPEVKNVLSAKDRVKAIFMNNWNKLKDTATKGASAVAEEIRLARMYKLEKLKQKRATSADVCHIRGNLFGERSMVQKTGLPKQLQFLFLSFSNKMRRLGLQPQVTTPIGILIGPPPPLRG